MIGDGYLSHQHPLCGIGTCRQKPAYLPERFSVVSQLFLIVQQTEIICLLLLFELLVQALLVTVHVLNGVTAFTNPGMATLAQTDPMRDCLP